MGRLDLSQNIANAAGGVMDAAIYRLRIAKRWRAKSRKWADRADWIVSDEEREDQ